MNQNLHVSEMFILQVYEIIEINILHIFLNQNTPNIRRLHADWYHDGDISHQQLNCWKVLAELTAMPNFLQQIVKFHE